MSFQTPTYTKLADRGVSFSLLRTNPKLTSNLKLTVDSDGGLWFNSIDATAELAQSKYKNFAIDPNSNHAINIFKFYDNGKTPNKISFAVGTTITTETVAKDLKDQYDFDLYSSGAKYLSSKEYKEKFSFLAPLYVDEVLPECFVILKIPEASNYTVGEWQEKIADPNFTNTDFALDLFQNAVIVKTIMLTEDSDTGTYIRNMLKNPKYPKNPLYVNFKKDEYSVYRGASINSGTYVEMPELLSKTLTRSLPQLTLEKYITGGFERNNIVHPKILNMEFLFDDDLAELYTFNRYIGFYCNLVDLVDFDIDINAMYSNTSDNDNPLPFNFRREDEISANITNSNGVVLRGIGVDIDLTELTTNSTTSNSIFFPYLKIKNDILKFPNLSTLEQVNNRIKFSIIDDSLDLGQLFGPGELLFQEEAIPSTQDTRTTIALTFESRPEHLDTIRLYHTNGQSYDRDSGYGNYDDIIFIDDDTENPTFVNNELYLVGYPTIITSIMPLTNPNDTEVIFSPDVPLTLGVQYISSVTGKKWIWDGSQYVLGVINPVRIYVNLNNSLVDSTNHTDLSKLAETIVEIITNLKNSFLIGKTFENTAFIQVQYYGDHYGQLAIRALDTFSERLSINGNTTTSVVYADGGFLSTQQAILPIGNVDRLLPILSQIVVKTEKDWSTIRRVANSVVSIDSTTTLDEASTLAYFNNATLMLADDEPTDILYDTIEIRSIFKPSIGVLSIFDVKDIDFYTYSTEYAKIPEIDLYQYYYIPQNTKILDFTQYAYEMVGTGVIEINGTTYSTISSADSEEVSQAIVWQNITGLHKYNIITGDVILIQSSKVPSNQLLLRQDIPIYDEDENLKNFTGFFSLGADHSVPNTKLLTYEYREKYKANNLLSEYNVYLENFDTEFAVEGRVVPYISKWGIIDSTDSRGNPYRLNSDIMFGKDNFGPSHHESSAVAEKMTHEWFYIESDFNYSDAVSLLEKNYYYFNEKFSVASMISDSSYFESYFTYNPIINGIEISKPQFRYSKLIFDKFTNQYYTIFNGIKFSFSELSESASVLSTTNRFDDYNFSILLVPVEEDLQTAHLPISYRIIENIDAKAIVILIDLPISSRAKINELLLQDSWDNSIDRNLLFPDRRLDQLTTFLETSSLISDTQPTKYQVDYIYTTSNDTDGDNVFLTLLNSSYPSFATDEFLAGSAINAITQEVVAGFIPCCTDTVLVIKGSELSKQFIVSFATSDLYLDVSAGTLNSGCQNLTNTSQYLEISTSKLAYVSTGATAIRIVQDSALLTGTLYLSINNELVISKVFPTFLSAFGDYRISFNEDGISNLTYAFLYSAKDKKYNSTKSAYSTVKLAIGVDLSNSNYTSTTEYYYLTGKDLGSITVPGFKLEDFINPLSASHDTLENPVALTTTPVTTVPMQAFSPLMFINTTGEVSFLLNSSATFTGVRADDQLNLINPFITDHAIVSVSDNILKIENSQNSKSPKTTIVLNISLKSDPTDGAIFDVSVATFPEGISQDWLIESQQFQLFGGNNYFSNLFESLSFANFKLLLENQSSLISWESYENGTLLTGQKIVMHAESPDIIEKSTIVVSTPEIVSTNSKTVVGGFSHTEKLSNSYEIYRYSGEYDIICRTVSAFNREFSISNESLIGANILLNPNVRNFFIIPEFSFVKYSGSNILDFEESQKFEPIYPMIMESPIDFTSYNTLSSSWDFNYHYEYSTKKNKVSIPGSRRVTEDYSFVSKLLNIPLSFEVESFNWVELTNSQFDSSDDKFLKLFANGELVDIAYSIFSNEIRFKINFAQVVSKTLSEVGTDLTPRLRAEFEKFFVTISDQEITTDSTVLGELTFDEYLYQYCKVNLLKLYTLDTIDFYQKNDHTLATTAINIVEVPYDQLDDAGYSAVKTVKINNSNPDIIKGSINKKKSSGISLVPKLKIKYI